MASRAVISKERPLKQQTIDLFVDQIEAIQKITQKTGLSKQHIIRQALDAQLGLPKTKKSK